MSFRRPGGTVAGMRVLMIAIPAVLAVAAYWFYLRGFKLCGAYLEQVKAAIEEKRRKVR